MSCYIVMATQKVDILSHSMPQTLLNYLQDRFDHDKIIQGLLLSLKSKLLHDLQIPTFLSPSPLCFLTVSPSSSLSAIC